MHSGGWRSEVGLVVKHIRSGCRLLVLVWDQKESLREFSPLLGEEGDRDSPPPVTGRLMCTVKIPSHDRGVCGGSGAHL